MRNQIQLSFINPPEIQFNFPESFSLKKFELGSKKIFEYPHKVLSIQIEKENFEKTLEVLNKIKNLHKSKFKIIVIYSGLVPSQLLQLINNFSIYKLIESSNQNEIQFIIQKAIDDLQIEEQNNELFDLSNSLNKKLTQSSNTLREKVEKRKSYLLNSIKRSKKISKKTLLIQKCLFMFNEAKSISAIESGLYDLLKSDFKIQSIKIQLINSIPKSKNAVSFPKNYIFELEISDEIESFLGKIEFIRENSGFKSREIDFLMFLANPLTLTIRRIITFNELDEVQKQWDATFDSITHPLCIIDEDFNLIHANQSFLNQSNLNDSRLSSKSLSQNSQFEARGGRRIPHTSTTKQRRDWSFGIGSKCYKSLFNMDTPCPGCRIGKHFKLQPQITQLKQTNTYRVVGQPIPSESNRKYFLHLYYDLSKELQFEQRKIKSTREAELGTIGSSIAHELNNPLTGILTLVHLLKSEIDSLDKNYTDVIEIEKAALRCKDTIQQLLGYSRKTEFRNSKFDLIDVIDSALSIISLHAKMYGISIEKNLGAKGIFNFGQRDLLTQAIVHYLEYFINQIAGCMNPSKSSRPKLSINVYLKNAKVFIKIKPLNLQSISPNTELQEDPFNTNIARDIILQHRGTVDFDPAKQTLGKLTISLPRLDFDDPVQIFDRPN